MAQTRTYRFLVAGTIIAVIGLLTIQVVLIDMAYRAADRAFQQNVNAALQTVAQGLEAQEIVMTVVWANDDTTNDVQVGPSQRPSRVLMRFVKAARGDSGVQHQSAVSVPDTPGQGPLPHTVHILRSERGVLHEEMILDTICRGAVRTGSNAGTSTGAQQYSFSYQTDGDSLRLHMTGTGSTATTVSTSGPGVRRALVSRVIDRLATADHQPIQKRITAGQLDTLLRRELRENGITLDPTFGVMSAGEDTLRIAGPGADRAELVVSPLRTRLFPADVLASRADLLVSFPGQRWYLLAQVGPYAFATVVFAAFIIAGFVYAFRTIARQQRLSMHVRDFINNMVHEFKTPLSTITLAAEAVVRPDVIGQRTRIRRYVHVIGEETERMRNGVSKILQMAVVEEGDYELSLVPLDVHVLLEKAASAFAVQVESRGGTLTLHTGTSPAHATADALHLTNIVHNILENAVKYTAGVPEIIIRTEAAAGMVTIRISDNGIGMAPGEAGRVFDKYYRVSTGNLHDVKGFGLGLAYVRLMVTAMKGTVAIESDPGKGTTVIVSLPGAREGAA
ncbi:MAG: HAMP domain-containing histidine kinase [Ignavibacteriae bacterium]|nr:HAMP domain-containing histidine kinase [Ignavibacteriota bacterium]